eukprot:gnl/TRDRNA2_/TRDRNA2_38916_c0_seq2.p1 gnl/TRDRNA2_/TRDRNA2_38916_c0~~gnl/TRDRNA2_/TRDRNA2_38916_c0_seq2.p1  ORF type:complete len:133 (+),score=15.72 gnl/TRDRNA2_/TRDRNA2_38916_c0_seq2:1-399(+)
MAGSRHRQLKPSSPVAACTAHSAHNQAALMSAVSPPLLKSHTGTNMAARYDGNYLSSSNIGRSRVLGKRKYKSKAEDDLISPACLSCAGYTLVCLMALAFGLFIRLFWQIGVIGYESRGAIYEYMLFRDEEL